MYEWIVLFKITSKNKKFLIETNLRFGILRISPNKIDFYIDFAGSKWLRCIFTIYSGWTLENGRRDKEGT